MQLWQVSAFRNQRILVSHSHLPEMDPGCLPATQVHVSMHSNLNWTRHWGRGPSHGLLTITEFPAILRQTNRPCHSTETFPAWLHTELPAELLKVTNTTSPHIWLILIQLLLPFLKNNFLVLFLVCWVSIAVWAFSGRGERDYFSRSTEAYCDGFFCFGAQALGSPGFSGCSSRGAQALEHRLSRCAHRFSCSEACGIFLDQGLNLCLQHLANRFFTTEPLGKLSFSIFKSFPDILIPARVESCGPTT